MNKEEAAIKVATARKKCLDSAWEYSRARDEERKILAEEAIRKQLKKEIK